MARYIDADKFIDALNYNTQNTWGKGLGTSWWSHSVKLKDNIVECINNQPTADVVEVKHGEWENIRQYEFGECYGNCSVCKTIVKASNPTELKLFNKYCPHCGAKMDGRRDT